MCGRYLYVLFGVVCVVWTLGSLLGLLRASPWNIWVSSRSLLGLRHSSTDSPVTFLSTV